MTEHFTRNTVSASFWCGKCEKYTQHRVDDRRKGPCLECIARLEVQHDESPKVPKVEQQSLFPERIA
jgi:Zn finger protein HypA/HybF involved in hydrogenase expression